jgi:hypothetical protein
VQPGALLTDDDRADVGDGCGFEKLVARVAKKHLDTLTLEDLCDRRSGPQRITPANAKASVRGKKKCRFSSVRNMPAMTPFEKTYVTQLVRMD